jgi:hypothetical protein
MLDGLVIGMRLRSILVLVPVVLVGTVLGAAAFAFTQAGSSGSARAASDAPAAVATPTSIDEVANAPSPHAAFASLLGDAAVTDGTTLSSATAIARAFDIPGGSVYAGHGVYAATAADGWTCVKVFDGSSCGQLTGDTPAVGFVLEHPSSGLPALAVGVTTDAVSAVRFVCPSQTYEAPLVPGGYVLALPDGATVAGCPLVLTLRDGRTLQFGQAH